MIKTNTVIVIHLEIYFICGEILLFFSIKISSLNAVTVQSVYSASKLNQDFTLMLYFNFLEIVTSHIH